MVKHLSNSPHCHFPFLGLCTHLLPKWSPCSHDMLLCTTVNLLLTFHKASPFLLFITCAAGYDRGREHPPTNISADNGADTELRRTQLKNVNFYLLCFSQQKTELKEYSMEHTLSRRSIHCFQVPGHLKEPASSRGLHVVVLNSQQFCIRQTGKGVLLPPFSNAVPSMARLVSPTSLREVWGACNGYKK